jgi:hypothetical protein
MRFKILIALAFSLSWTGCATVKPWDKSELSQPQMDFVQKNPGRFFIEHALIAMEQAEGGDGKAGGGCGCR